MKNILFAGLLAASAFASSPARADTLHCHGSSHEIWLHKDADGSIVSVTVREYKSGTYKYDRCKPLRGGSAVLECTELYNQTDWVTVYRNGSASWDHEYNAEPSEGEHLKCE